MKFQIIAHTPQGMVTSKPIEAEEEAFTEQKYTLLKRENLRFDTEDGFIFLPEAVFKQSVIEFKIIPE